MTFSPDIIQGLEQLHGDGFGYQTYGLTAALAAGTDGTHTCTSDPPGIRPPMDVACPSKHLIELMPTPDVSVMASLTHSGVPLSDLDPAPDWIMLHFSVDLTIRSWSSGCAVDGISGCGPLFGGASIRLDKQPYGDQAPHAGLGLTGVKYTIFSPSGTVMHPAEFSSNGVVNGYGGLNCFLGRDQSDGMGYAGDPGNDASALLWRPSEITDLEAIIVGNWHTIASIYEGMTWSARVFYVLEPDESGAIAAGTIGRGVRRRGRVVGRAVTPPV